MNIEINLGNEHNFHGAGKSQGLMAAITGTLQAPFRFLRRYWLLALVGLVIAAAGTLFLVVSFRDTDTPTDMVTISPQEMNSALYRFGTRPEGDLPDLDVLMFTPTYFAATGKAPPEEAVAEPSLLFFISEEIHVGEIPLDPPQPLLRVDGGRRLEPVDFKVLIDTEHHRTMVARYAGVAAGGGPLVTENTGRLALVFPEPIRGVESISNVMTWKLPIEYTEGFASREVVLRRPGADALTVPPLFGNQAITWAAFLAIMAGLLIALSPCLLQLGVYYTAILAATHVEEGNPGSMDAAAAKKHIIQTGLFFTVGFTAVYTVAGAAAGSIGRSLDTLGLFSVWLRPLSVVAGIVIILLAVRVAWNARAPLVCRLPMPAVFGKGRRTGVLGAALMGISFAGGCLACFGATVLPALLLYAGGTGSVAYGALLLLIFSLGIALPCLILAFGIARFQPVLQRLDRFGPSLALASALVMVGFGLLMITNQFHIISGLIGRYINL